ncbi:MAG: BatA domain-containing protein [Gemmatimonadetes bacterium]|nr:BatA domain-containing protein [Gemmatimonadota bacterium]
MSLFLLAPLFLLGLGTLVVPVIVHLIHRHKRESIPFPSLMFIQRIPYKDVRRQQLRHKLLFAIRCLALILLALAFARPFLENATEATAADIAGREVVILLDRSHSMRFGDRWQRGVEQARARLDLLGPLDRATVVLFAETAEVTGETAIERAQPTAGGTRYGSALQLAGRILSESEQPEREVVLITDFQRSGWDRVSDVRLPGGTIVTAVDLSEDETHNISLPFVSLRQEVLSGREWVSVTTRVVNGGERQVVGLRVALVLNGQELQSRTVTVDPLGSTAVTFSPVLLPEGVSRGAVTAGTDALPQDNTVVFVLSPSNSLSALILESSDARENQSLFLSRALEIGDRPSFRVDVRPLREFRLSDLDGRSVLVLNDAPLPGGRAGQRIREFVENGGGLLVVLGERNGPQTWPANVVDLLPGVVGARVDLDRGPITMSTMEYGNPVFDVFSAPRSGDFSAAKFFRYRDLTVDDPQSVLARYSDGQVALAEKRFGDGIVLVWTSTADTYWNDLALQPVFLPFVHRMMRYLAGYEEVRPFFIVGETLKLTRESPDKSIQALMDGGGDLVVQAPSGNRTIVQAGAGEQVVELTEQGFYEIRQVDGGKIPPAFVAVNIDPSESDLAKLDIEEFLGAVTPMGDEGSVGARARKLTVEEREHRQQLWWYLLIAAMLMLVAETAISNRLSRVAR